jgi:hypothetical protein
MEAMVSGDSRLRKCATIGAPLKKRHEPGLTFGFRPS